MAGVLIGFENRDDLPGCGSSILSASAIFSLSRSSKAEHPPDKRKISVRVRAGRPIFIGGATDTGSPRNTQATRIITMRFTFF